MKLLIWTNVASLIYYLHLIREKYICEIHLNLNRFRQNLAKVFLGCSLYLVPKILIIDIDLGDIDI